MREAGSGFGKPVVNLGGHGRIDGTNHETIPFEPPDSERTHALRDAFDCPSQHPKAAPAIRGASAWRATSMAVPGSAHVP
jgi:hypothetical protein